MERARVSASEPRRQASTSARAQEGDRPRSRHGGAAEAGVRHHGVGARQRVRAAEAGVDERASVEGSRPRSRHDGAVEAGVQHHGAGAHQRVGAAEAGVDERASGRVVVVDFVDVEVVVEEAELRDDPKRS